MKKLSGVLMGIVIVTTSVMVVKAASEDVNIAPNADYHQYVEFVEGPNVMPDIYYGGASLTGSDSDMVQVAVKGGTQSNPSIIDVTLAVYTQKSVHADGAAAGWGNTYGYIRGNVYGVDHEIRSY